MISAVFGVVWTEWGASGVPGGASGVIRIAGIAVGLTIFLSSAFLFLRTFSGAGPRRTDPGQSESTEIGPARPGFRFSPLAYLVVVVLEIAAFRGGTALLDAIGRTEYQSAMVAFIVGLHFVAFGRLFWAGFYWLALALIGAGVAGAVVGATGGGVHAIEAVSGLIAAASLFASGAWTIVWSMGRRSDGEAP